MCSAGGAGGCIGCVGNVRADASKEYNEIPVNVASTTFRKRKDVRKYND